MTELAQDLAALLRRFRAELDYNDAKGSNAYRQGMHDGLHFAADALQDVLSAHDLLQSEHAGSNGRGEIPSDYGV
jgi:hypothetical protein